MIHYYKILSIRHLFSRTFSLSDGAALFIKVLSFANLDIDYLYLDVRLAPRSLSDEIKLLWLIYTYYNTTYHLIKYFFDGLFDQKVVKLFKLSLLKIPKNSNIAKYKKEYVFWKSVIT